jgi:hypothetical protein
VHIVCNVASAHFTQWDSQIARKDLDRHGGLLLPNPGKCLKTPAELNSGGRIRPQPPSIAAVLIEHNSRRAAKPLRHEVYEPVQLGLALNSLSHTLRVRSQCLWVQDGESLPKFVGQSPCALGADSHVGNDGQQERERVRSDQCISFPIPSELGNVTFQLARKCVRMRQ